MKARIFRAVDGEVFVQPHGSTQWLDSSGKPKSFLIDFRNGYAEVDQELASYMVDNGIASRLMVSANVRLPAAS